MCGVLSSDTTGRSKALLEKKWRNWNFWMSACRWEPLMVQQLRQIIFHVLRKKITLWTLGFERHTCATRCSPAVTQSWAKSCSWLTVSEFSLHGCVVPWTWGEAMLRWAACDKENWLICRHPGNRQQRRCQGQHISFQATQYNPPPSFHCPRTMLSKHKPIHG